MNHTTTTTSQEEDDRVMVAAHEAEDATEHAIDDDVGSLILSSHLLKRSSNGGLCMREQDADWLESIHVHGGPNKTGMTPVLSSLGCLGTDPDPLDWQDDADPMESIPGMERNGSIASPSSSSLAAMPPDRLHLPKNPLPLESPVKNKNLLSKYEEALEPLESRRPVAHELTDDRSEARRVLSGTIYEETEEYRTSTLVPTVDLSSFSTRGNTATTSILSTVRPTNNQNHRTEVANAEVPPLECGDAIDAQQRRRTEAAQFAEALGCTDDYDVQIIEEDDLDAAQDDDDVATEIIHIQHQQQRNPVGGLLPIKLRSSRSTATSSGNPILPPPAALRCESAAPETPIPPARRTKVPSSSAGAVSSSPRSGFLAPLPDALAEHHDFYKGIGANPPDIVTRGITRGNYAQLHRKAWLEVTDKYHRYGKNLRLYYRFWESEGHPTNIFFDWLDSKGDAAGNELPELPDCPRRQLDSDTVLYITNPTVTQGYAIQVVVVEEEEEDEEHDRRSNGDGCLRRGRMYDVDGQPVVTGPDGWIFVLRDNVLYGAKKITSISGQSRQRFHHSSFFGGKAVAAAGIFITDDHGFLTRLYPHSGHYRPGEAHMQRVLFFLYHEGVDLRSFEMDTQQIMHVARDFEPTLPDPPPAVVEVKKTEKKKKVEVLHLLPAFYIACFLAHKARCIGEGIFAQIHQIRQSDVASVSEALAVIDQGGFWKKKK